jgi:hypothetical protein
MVRLCAIIAVLLMSPLVVETGRAAPQILVFDISSGGQPTISGSLGGSVTGSANLAADLVVTVNFGELSPINPNGIVKVVVPVAIRGLLPYQVTVSATGAGNSNPDALQLSDIGFGIQNLRRLARGNQSCQAITPLFNNDPAVSVNLTNRASYPSSLANIGNSTAILRGRRLSGLDLITPRPQYQDNGWTFDAVLAVAPQFFSPSNLMVTLTFRISFAPLPC